MRKILFFLTLILLIVLGVAAYNYSHHLTTSDLLATPTPAPQPWQPAQLRIPHIHVAAPVMAVGKTDSGAMDAPTSQALHSPYWTSVFWYEPGVAPGQTGNAVIAGHVDRVGGDPAVFWYLKNLVPGDDIFVQTFQGNTLHFVVNRVVSYSVNAPSAPIIDAVFGPASAHHLNLITCSGVWTGSGYDQRLVVFTTQVNS